MHVYPMPLVPLVVHPCETMVNLLEGWCAGIDHWQPEIIYEDCCKAVRIVTAFCTEIDNGSHPLALQAFYVMIEHKRTTEEK